MGDCVKNSGRRFEIAKKRKGILLSYRKKVRLMKNEKDMRIRKARCIWICGLIMEPMTFMTL